MKVGEQKIIVTKFDSLDGKTVVGFTSEDSSFSMRASRQGVEVQGVIVLTSQSELQEFAKLMSDAWTQHRKLMPNLTTNLAGH